MPVGSRVKGPASAFVTLATMLAMPAPAGAYSYESSITAGCHEDITTQALRQVRREFDTASPLPTDRDDRIIVDDMPVPIASDMRDIAGATIILGVRDNDLKGRYGLDATDLASVHGDDDGQREHCLRRAAHDEAPLTGQQPEPPFGSEAALIECRDFIRELVEHAIVEGLDDDGFPDASKRTVLDVHMAFSGRVNIRLPLFYLYMGQALHTLQDSFTHAFRTPDGKSITVILNWVDFAKNKHKERRDGPAHMTELDQCEKKDELRRSRRAQATEASTKLLAAALNPELDSDEKMARVDEVLVEYMSYEPGCTYDNRWCDAPENELRPPPGCSCEAIGTARLGWLALVLSPLALGVTWGRRRRRLARNCHVA